MDRSEDIRKELNELISNAVYSFIIISILLALIFRKLIYSFIIILSIAFSLLFTFLLFYVFNISLNIITIASLVLGFGLMVDNSIVVIDYIDRHYKGQGIKYLAVYTKDIFPPIFASTITTIAVFIPLLFLTGELQEYFKQFALAITFAITASLIISFTLVPSLYLKFGSPSKVKIEKKPSIILKLYDVIQRAVFRWKKTAITFLILLIGLPVWLLPEKIETPVIGDVYNSTFGSSFFQENKKIFNYAFGGAANLFFNYIPKGQAFSFNDRNYIGVYLRLPHGNDINIINALTKQFENEILVYKDKIKSVVTNVNDKESAYINIDFTPKQSRRAFPYMLKNYLGAYATQLGGLNVSVFGYGMGFSNGGFGDMSSYSVKVRGFNYEKVKEIAEEFREHIVKNPRISNVDIDKSGFWGEDDTYEVVGKIKREKLAQYDIDPQTLFGIIANSSQGNILSNVIQLGNDEVSYDIKYSNYEKIQLREINDMTINENEKGSVKVKDIIDFDRRKTLSTIMREDRQYVRYIGFDFKGPYEFGQKFIEASGKSVQVPAGYEIITKSDFHFFDKEEEIEIWKILGLSILLIFIITAGLFESFRKPFLIILAIPFAFIGVIFTFHFFELTLDRGAYAGLLLLIGVSVNNSIMLVDYLSHAASNDFKAIILLSYYRVRPIMTTTFTTIAGLVPIILFGEESFWKSLSYSAAGGLFISAVFTLVFLPLFYYMFMKRKNENRDI